MTLYDIESYGRGRVESRRYYRPPNIDVSALRYVSVAAWMMHDASHMQVLRHVILFPGAVKKTCAVKAVN